eukprot:Nk52_evm1s1502 gene=Nk52_evmTU1s1502
MEAHPRGDEGDSQIHRHMQQEDWDYQRPGDLRESVRRYEDDGDTHRRGGDGGCQRCLEDVGDGDGCPREREGADHRSAGAHRIGAGGDSSGRGAEHQDADDDEGREVLDSPGRADQHAEDEPVEGSIEHRPQDQPDVPEQAAALL